jgi:AcrR family transcriptional regulator
MFIVDLSEGVSMPAATRERGLEAAVELLGAEGVRALTHARVDERAGLPPGSTSNWFRTRRALLGGIVDWIAERERADLEPAAMPTISGVDELIEGLCAMAELQTGPFAARTRARYALFLELADDPELGEPLRRQRREFERWTERIMIAVGIADPVPATRALMALGDGLLLYRLTVDPDLDMRPAIERAVRALAES